MDVVAICNLALSHLGQSSVIVNIDPPDQSREARLCAIHYPTARDFLIAKAKPSFARKRGPLTDASLTVTLPATWAYAYALPSSSIHFFGVFDPTSVYDETAQPYEHEINDDDDQVLYTNTADAWGRWLIAVTDASKFPPLFAQALSYVLAGYLAGPIIKGAAGVETGKGHIQMGLAMLGLFEADDANQRERAEIRDEVRHLPSWIAARGYASYTTED